MKEKNKGYGFQCYYMFIVVYKSNLGYVFFFWYLDYFDQCFFLFGKRKFIIFEKISNRDV